MKAASDRLNNLPIPPNPLVGREREIQAVRHLLQSDLRLVTLTGPGGVGKTRLGLEVAASLAENFADGVSFVPLAAVIDPTLVPSAIAQTLDIREFGSRPPAENLALFLRGRTILLVLDNFEQVGAAAPVVAALLATCPGLKVLATARAPLHVQGEQEFPVPPLTLPAPPDANDDTDILATLSRSEAGRLFLARARAIKPDFAVTAQDAPSIAQICARLDGLPLAVELAAARIKLLHPPALLARLQGSGSPLHLLTGGPGDLPARQRTLRDTIAWSYNLLSPDEQALFRQLSVFVGDFALEAAEATCLVSPPPDVLAGPSLPRFSRTDLEDALAGLVDKSLVLPVESVTSEPRLTMLQTIRDFAGERLVASGDAQAMHERHADYFLRLVETAEPRLNGPDQGSWLDRLEAEHENVRASLRWFLDSGDAARALRLSGGLWRFWFLRGYLGEGRRWLDEALDLAGDQSSVARAKVLVGAGVLAHYQGDYGRAASLCGVSLSLARELGDSVSTAAALNGLALVARSGGNYGAACAMYDESLRILRVADDRAALASTLAYSGYCVWLTGDDATALARYAEGLAIYRSLGDRWGIATALVMQGLVAEGQGDLPSARALLEEALARFREVGDRRSITRTLRALGDVAFEHEDYPLAFRRYAESLGAFWQIGDRFFVAVCLDGLAGVNAAWGYLEQSARLFGAAAFLRESIGAPVSPADLRLYARNRTLARTALGAAAFDSAWEAGRTMALEEAVAVARQDPTTADPEGTPAPTAVGAKGSTIAMVLPSRPIPRNAAGLTPRELEVLRLVALGMTDAQVADRLVLSPRTINSHLHSIYGKLGVSSRSAATRYAVDHQLAEILPEIGTST